MRIIITIIAGAVLWTSAMGGAHALTYGENGIRPAFPRADNPRTNDIFIYDLLPGSVIGDAVVIYNNSDRDKNFLLYPADSTPSTDGGYACEQLSQERDAVGSWIALGVAGTKDEALSYIGTLDADDAFNADIPYKLHVPARGSRYIPMRISVPDDVGVGEYNGCILIQEDDADRQKSESGINLQTRSGLRVAITVPGDIVRKLTIEGFTVIVKEDGSVILHPMLKNNGNVSVDADVSIVVYDMFGRVFKEYGGKYSILLHELTEWNFDLPETFWGGFFHAVFDVAYVDHAGVEQTLHYDNGWFFVVPSFEALMIIGSGFVLLVALIFFFVLWRKRKKWIAREWTKISTTKEMTIRDLAKEYGVSWKILAKANKLKPPYDLHDVASLRVPPKKENEKKKSRRRFWIAGKTRDKTTAGKDRTKSASEE